jgi:hypothetical protein
MVTNEHMVMYRRQPLKMWRDEDAQWRWSGEVTELWEVICPACGDDCGPYGEQSELIQRLRGPFDHEEEAKAAVIRHSDGMTSGTP